MPEKFLFQIQETIKQNRLDNFLCGQITFVSKIYLRNLIERGGCLVSGEIKPRGYHLRKGDAVEIEVDLTTETAMKPEPILISVVYEDEEIIVVEKPTEMLVHPSVSQKTGTLLNALSYYFNAGKDELLETESKTQNQKSEIIRPGLIHRLDRKTSGLMIIAKTPRAMSALSNHFQRKLVKKKYLAIVQGAISADLGTIDAPIGRFEEENRWGVKEDGKASETNFRVLERFADKTLLELEPVTGRTNQLRIHCAHVGHPIIGDDRYGGRSFSRLCLHAAQLNFFHPATGVWTEFESNLPAELQLFLEK